MLQEFQLLFILASKFITHDFVYTESSSPFAVPPNGATWVCAAQGGLICLPLGSSISGVCLAGGRLGLADGPLPAPSASWPLKGPAAAVPGVCEVIGTKFGFNY